MIQKTMRRRHSNEAEIDPKIGPKLAGAIAVKQCGIGSPTRARTWDLRINSLILVAVRTQRQGPPTLAKARQTSTFLSHIYRWRDVRLHSPSYIYGRRAPAVSRSTTSKPYSNRRAVGFGKIL